MSERIVPIQHVTKEKTLARAVTQARDALRDVAHDSGVGEHVGVVLEAERQLTHLFECRLPGYRGWLWAVTMSRVPRARRGTVDEISLLPGEDALLAPDWVPWADRLRPDDVSGTDRLPYQPDDAHLTANLQPGLEATGEDADACAQWEIGLGRVRVLSDKGRREAFQRWYESDAGPRNRATRKAQAQCATCGYLMRMGGSARQVFGVCANEWSEWDGRVVSLDHGCGSHSETDVKSKKEKLWDPADFYMDDEDTEFEPNDAGEQARTATNSDSD